MNESDYQEYRLLQKNGVDVQKTNQIRQNAGSETLAHLVAKTVVAHIGLERGYNVASEVEVPDGEIDIVLWTGGDKLNYAVEVETSPEAKTMQSKQSRYVRAGIDDMLSVNVSEMPVNYLEARDYIIRELGL